MKQFLDDDDFLVERIPTANGDVHLRPPSRTQQAGKRMRQTAPKIKRVIVAGSAAVMSGVVSLAEWLKRIQWMRVARGLISTLVVVIVASGLMWVVVQIWKGIL